MNKYEELSLRCKLNKKIYYNFTGSNEFTDYSRVVYVAKDFLIKNSKLYYNLEIINKTWVEISNDNNRENKILVIISFSNNIDQNDIYINPILYNLLGFYSEDSENNILLNVFNNNLKPNKMSNDAIFKNKNIPNIPLVKRIKLMKLFSLKNNNNVYDLIKKEFAQEIKFISLNQVIPILPLNSAKFDLTSGVYVNCLLNFKIIEVEIEEYDYLRLYFEENIVKNLILDEKSKYDYNTFLCNKGVEIEFVENNFKKTEHLPLNLNYFHSYSNIYKNQSVNSKIQHILDIPQFKDYYKRVKSLFTSYSSRLINKNFFFTGPQNCGKKYILSRLADKFGYNYFSKDLNDFNRIEKLVSYLKRMEFFTPCIVNLKNFQRINDLIKSNETLWSEITNIINFSHKNKMILVFTVNNVRDIDQNVRSLIDFTFEISIPNLNSRIQIIHLILNNLFNYPNIIFNTKYSEKIQKLTKRLVQHKIINLSSLYKFENSELDEIGKLTVGKDLSDLKNLCILSFENFIRNLKTNYKNKNFEDFSNGLFDKKYLISAFQKIKSTKIYEEKNSTSSIPEVKWEDVGGLESAKGDIYDTIQLPLKYPKLFENGLKRRTGLLLFGPPGSGKTLLAKAIANECSMNFLSIKGPELLNMYVGESEKNIRDIFEKGRENRPCVLFFDEIDALAPARSKNTDSNNVMDRIVAQFMSEMDGLTKENDLIIIASTNRPDLLDVSLLRPGRFDKMIYIGLPKSKEEKHKIYKAQTRNLELEEDVNLDKISQISPENYSGADIFAVCSLSFTYAMKDYLSLPNENNKFPKIKVSNKHFLMALEKVHPSLTSQEIFKYEELKKKYSINQT